MGQLQKKIAKRSTKKKLVGGGVEKAGTFLLHIVPPPNHWGRASRGISPTSEATRCGKWGIKRKRKLRERKTTSCAPSRVTGIGESNRGQRRAPLRQGPHLSGMHFFLSIKNPLSALQKKNNSQNKFGFFQLKKGKEKVKKARSQKTKTL